MCSILEMFFFKITVCFFFIHFGMLFSSEILIKVQNLPNDMGAIHVAIYDKAENFPKKNGKFLGLKKNVNEVFYDGIIVKNLEAGKYAIAIYHDQNNNNKFDRFLGLPSEKYGFSNDAKIFFGPPNFEEASFDLLEKELKKIFIKLR